MPKSKSSPADKRRKRPQRQPRDPSPDRRRAIKQMEELEESDGVVDAEMEEFDTERYEIPERLRQAYMRSG